MMRLEISAAAQADLRTIGDYIARDNARRAVSFMRELQTACRRIAEAPRGSPLLAGSRDPAFAGARMATI